MSNADSGRQATHSQEGVRHTLEIVVPADTMAAHLDEVARAFRDRARLPGFRKGKAPLGMIRKQFGDDIRQRVLDHAIPEQLSAELEARGLNPIDSPQLEKVAFEPGSSLSFTVQFDTAPDVVAENLDLAARRPAAQVTEEMIDEAIGQLRERAARLIPAEEHAVAGHGSYARCEIRLLPKDGKGKRLAEENRFVHVGHEQAIPGLNEQLEGLAVGQERAFVTRLPEGFPNAILAGKEVRCHVGIQELKRRHLPEVDDDFARDFGFNDLAALREQTAQDLRRNAEREAERAVDNQLLESLREKNPVAVPESLIERRLDEMTRRFATDLTRQGIDPRGALDWNAFRGENRGNAAASLAEEMLLDRIADDAGIEVDDERVTTEIRTQLEKSEGGKDRPPTSVIQQMRKDGSFEGLRLTLRRRLALVHLRQRATIDLDGGENASTDEASD